MALTCAFDGRRRVSTVTVTRRPDRFWCQTPATCPSINTTGKFPA
jgi:hypothetical protein